MYLFHLLQFDDLQFTVSFEMWVKLSWRDNRIRIKAVNNSESTLFSTHNITMMVLENTDILNHIWVAQISIPHQKLSSRQHGPPLINDMVNFVIRDGEVWVDLWSTVKPTITCPMSFNWFPFDQQKCNLIIRVRKYLYQSIIILIFQLSQVIYIQD